MKFLIISVTILSRKMIQFPEEPVRMMNSVGREPGLFTSWTISAGNSGAPVRSGGAAN